VWTEVGVCLYSAHSRHMPFPSPPPPHTTKSKVHTSWFFFIVELIHKYIFTFLFGLLAKTAEISLTHVL
jgi:hypothetical protein